MRRSISISSFISNIALGTLLLIGIILIPWPAAKITADLFFFIKSIPKSVKELSSLIYSNSLRFFIVSFVLPKEQFNLLEIALCESVFSLYSNFISSKSKYVRMFIFFSLLIYMNIIPHIFNK